MKVQLGAGDDPKRGYTNVDLYETIPDGDYTYISKDIFEFLEETPDNSLDEIYAKWLFEHIAFPDEERLWRECYRTLKPGGKLQIYVPDFEFLCERFLKAKEGFKGFYKLTTPDDPAYGFGFGYDREIENRWGTLMVFMFGVQTNPGQFHRNAYTEQRVIDIFNYIGFTNIETNLVMERNIRNVDAIGIKPE